MTLDILRPGALVLLACLVTAAPFAGALPLPAELGDLVPPLYDIPGLWFSYGSAWGPAPASGSGLAQKMDIAASGYAFLTVRMPAAMQVEDIASLRFDSYYESGGCGGGSPRVQLSIDTDGDGDRDGNVFVYAGPSPNFGGCPLGTWTTNDLRDGAPRWDSSQIGGGFYGTQASAQAAAGPSHQVLRASLVYDSGWLFGPTVTWYDNFELNCFKLGEVVHVATSVAAGAGVCLPL